MKKFLLPIISIVLASTGCAQPVAMNEETSQITSFTVQDVDSCEIIISETGYTPVPREDRDVLRDLAAAHWVLVDDETLRMALRDLHMMNFDRYQIIGGDVFQPDAAGATAGRSKFQIETEYRQKRDSIVSRCLKISDEDKLVIFLTRGY